MPPLFGSSRRERDRLVTTLDSLGPTTVSGLSAALSWSEGRTKRTIRAVNSHHEANIRLDSTARSVSLVRPKAAPKVVPTAEVEGSVPPGALPVAPDPPVARRAAVTPSMNGTWSAKCPNCQVGLSTTGTAGLLVCPECGELHHAPSQTLSSIPPPVRAPSVSTVAPIRAPPVAIRPRTDDRRSQELFAAWVTARPIPCPKCQTPLRHRGVAQYGCPACGEMVQFDPAGGGVAAPSAPSVRTATVRSVG
jgi:predicted RNA-binding Zn-ribbon protein involved in translation (DUF1610 family)